MYDFTKKAIRYNTDEELQHLISLAEAQGHKYLDCFIHHRLNGYLYFMRCTASIDENLNTFSNYQESDIEDESIVSYSDFISSATTHPQETVEGC